MPNYPYNKNARTPIATDSLRIDNRMAFVSAYDIAPSVSADDAILADTAGDIVEVEVATGFTNPDVPRNLTLTISGTALSVKAGTLTVEGTDILGNAVTEDFTITEDTVEVLVGDVVFRSVTKMTIPAQDAIDVNFRLGSGVKLGLPDHLSKGNTIILTMFNKVVEATAPALNEVAEGSEQLQYITLNSALDGSDITVYYIV